MKRFLIAALLLSSSLAGAFAKTSDFEIGATYGKGLLELNETSSGIKLKNETAEGFGFYVAGYESLGEHLELFDECSMFFPGKVSLNYEYGGMGFSISDGDMFSTPYMTNFTLGLGGTARLSTSLKVRAGIGAEYCLIVSKLEYLTLESVELDMAFGMALKASATYMFSNSVGLNLGIAGDILFGGIYNTQTRLGSSVTKDEGSFSRMMYIIRPEAGLTIRFGKVDL